MSTRLPPQRRDPKLDLSRPLPSLPHLLLSSLPRTYSIVKGRSRDTAWFSMIDDEWPLCKAAFEAWLRDENFDEEGRQKVGLKEIREGLGAKAETNGESAKAKGEQ